MTATHIERPAQAGVRDRILDAAEHRLWHFGFKKTTIDEIATDAGVGKGTVYLHFESKEDIAFEIIARYKLIHLEELAAIAKNQDLSMPEKLTKMLAAPILDAHERCNRSPVAQEFILAVRPHIHARIQPYREREIVLLAGVVAEGIARGEFRQVDTYQVAQTLKHMTTGFLPPFPCISGNKDIETEIGRMVNLAISGLSTQEQQTRKAGQG